MIYAIYVALVAITFLIVLNGYLHGSKKAQLDAMYSFLLLGLIVASFSIASWKFGLLSIAVVFIGALLTRPLAAHVASWLLSALNGNHSRAYIGLPPKPLKRISQELGRQIDLSELYHEILSDRGRREQPLQKLLEYCEGQSAIRELMAEHKITRDDLEELYYDLLRAGAGQWVCGHWVAASAIAYPHTLRYLLDRQDVNWTAVAYNLIIHFERGKPLEKYSNESIGHISQELGRQIDLSTPVDKVISGSDRQGSQKEKIKGLFRSLDQSEKQILVLYYLEKKTFNEIGEVLNLSESCVSQMHSSIISHLKSKLNQ